MLDGNECSTIQVKHSYTKRGVYRVTIQGQCDNLFGHYHNPNYVNNNKPRQTLSLRKTLYGVLVPKNRVSPLKYAYGSFFGCENLNYVGKGIFDGLEECKTLAHLFDGTNIDYVYPNIFSGCPNVESFAYTFEACPFKFLYSNIFKWTVKAENFQHCFHRCIVFKQIPQKLFHYVPLASNFNACFRSCTSVTKVPEDLFDNCYYISDMEYCFCGGKDKEITTDGAYNPIMFINHIPQVWNKPSLRGAKFNRYAHGCKHANNYNSYVTWTKLNGYDT